MASTNTSTEVSPTKETKPLKIKTPKVAKVKITKEKVVDTTIESDFILSDKLSKAILGSKKLEPFNLGIERIHYDHVQQSWVITQHLPIDVPFDSFQNLPDTHKSQINKLVSFAAFFKKQVVAESNKTTDISTPNLTTKKSVSLRIYLYLPKEHKDNKQVFQVVPERGYSQEQIQNNPDLAFRIKNLEVTQLSNKFSETNFYSAVSNKDKSFIPQKQTSENINQSRLDNTAKSFSKSLLGQNIDNGLILDGILFSSIAKKTLIFKYSLCQEDRPYLSPMTEHPNNEFHKNQEQFTKIFELSKLLNGSMLLVNYARPASKHKEITKLMIVKDVIPDSSTKEYVVTSNIVYTTSQLKNKIDTDFFNLLSNNPVKTKESTHLNEQTSDLNNNSSKNTLKPSTIGQYSKKRNSKNLKGTTQSKSTSDIPESKQMKLF